MAPYQVVFPTYQVFLTLANTIKRGEKIDSVKTHSPGPLCNGEDDTRLNIVRPQLEFEALLAQ